MCECSLNLELVRGGVVPLPRRLTGRDSMPDLGGVEGGRVRQPPKLGGRDAWLRRLPFLLDGEPEMSPPGCPTGVSIEKALHDPEDEEDEDREPAESEDAEPAEGFDGRDLWIRRLTKERV